MAYTAKAIVSRSRLSESGWTMESVEVRKPGPGELLVEMVASGVCHTDVLIGDLVSGASPVAFYPRVLGHEGSAFVREVGPNVTVAQPGDSILLSYAFCNECQLCAADHRSHCLRFNNINFSYQDDTFKLHSNESAKAAMVSGAFFGQSSFAQLSIVKECSVVNVKDTVRERHELELFAPLGCGIQTGSGTAVNVAKVGLDDVVCVLVLGGVGLSAIMGAKVQGCHAIIGIDRVKTRLELAKELGATAVIHSGKLNGKTLVEAVQQAADGIGPTVSIETTGVPSLIMDALKFTRPMGRIIQVGAAPFDFTLGIDVFDWMVQGKQYIGAVEGHAHAATYVPQMIKWYREGKFPIDRLIKRLPASEFSKALEEMHDGSVIKPVLCWPALGE